MSDSGASSNVRLAGISEVPNERELMNGTLAILLADGVYIGGGVLLVILIVLLLLLFLRRA